MSIISFTFTNGRVEHTEVRLPFVVRRNGHTRAFRSIEKARAAAEAGSSIFFDYAPGCGILIEHR